MSSSHTITPKLDQGFTLIELVMVIVILGILAAFALPRFADLGGDARASVRQGMLGAMKAAASITHTKCLVDSDCDPGSRRQVLMIEGVEINMVYGYPAASDDGITAAAQLDGVTTFGGGISRPTRPSPPYTVAIDNQSDCTIVYGAARSNGSGPTYSGETDCN